jgi:hypothetical protein
MPFTFMYVLQACHSSRIFHERLESSEVLFFEIQCSNGLGIMEVDGHRIHSSRMAMVNSRPRHHFFLWPARSVAMMINACKEQERQQVLGSAPG